MFNEYKTEDKFFDKINTNNYRRNFLLIFLFISLIYIFPLVVFNLYNNDLSFHVYRLKSIATNMQYGVWLPAPQAENVCGWGYQLSVFYPSAFLYPFAILITFFNINPRIAFIIMIISLDFISCIIGYMSLYKIQKNKKIAFYFAILCGINPIRIFELIFFGFVGSYIALTFIPCVIFGTYDLIKNNKWKMLVFGMTGILYSHLITFLLSVIFIIICCSFNTKKFINEKNKIFQLIKAGIISLFMSLGFLIPFIYYYTSDVFKLSYNKEETQIIPVFELNINPFISIILQVIIIICLIKLNKFLSNKTKNKTLSVSICVVIWGIISLSDIFPWELVSCIPFLGNIQTSLRLIELLSIFLIFCFVDVVISVKDWNKICISLFISFIFLTSLCFYNLDNKSYEENPSWCYNNLENKDENTFFDIVAGEYLPLSFKINNKHINDINFYDLMNRTYIFSEESKYKIIKENLKTTITLETDNTTNILVPLVYYKGYEAKLNNKKIEVKELDGKIFLEDITSGTVVIEYEVQWFEYLAAIFSIGFTLIFYINSIYKYKKRC